MDEGTYWDRVQRIAHMMDPRNSLATGAEVLNAKEARCAAASHCRLSASLRTQLVRSHDAGERVVEGARAAA